MFNEGFQCQALMRNTPALKKNIFYQDFTFFDGFEKGVWNGGFVESEKVLLIGKG